MSRPSHGVMAIVTEQRDDLLLFGSQGHDVFSRSGLSDAITHVRDDDASTYADAHLQFQSNYMEHANNGLEPAHEDDYVLQQAFETYIDMDERHETGHGDENLQHQRPNQDELNFRCPRPWHETATDLQVSYADAQRDVPGHEPVASFGTTSTRRATQVTLYHEDSIMPDSRYNDEVQIPGMIEEHFDDDFQTGSSEHDEDERVLRKMAEVAERAYLSQNPLQDLSLPHATLCIADFNDPPDADSMERYVTTKQNEGYFHDRWEVDKESAKFLAGVMRDTKEDESSEMRYNPSKPLYHFKAEEPILQSDPVTDMRNIIKRNEVHITPKGMKPFILDKDKDQALEWGSKHLAIPAQLNRELAVEKWKVDAETMAFMKAILADDGPSLEDWARQKYERKVICKASPTLLPLSPSLSPMGLPSPIANLELTSTPDDPTVQEVARLRAQVAALEEDEAQEAIYVGMNYVKDFLVDDQCTSPAPLRAKTKRLQGLKMSSPLLPPDFLESSEPPSKKAKTVAFTEELHIVIPRLPSQDEMTDPEVGAQEAAASMARLLEPLARPALDRIVNEELCEADTIARVPIPLVSPIKVTAPWNQPSEPQNLLSELHQDFVSEERRWSGVSKLEKSLPWAPFSSRLAKIRPEGDFDDGSCVRYLRELRLDEEVDMQRFVWKPEGLRILDEDEHENEEIHPVDWPTNGCDEVDEEEQNLDVPQAEVVTLPALASRPPAPTAMVAAGTLATTHDPIQLPARKALEKALSKPVTSPDARLPATAFSKVIQSMPRTDSCNERLGASTGATRVPNIEEILKQRKAKLDQAASTNVEVAANSKNTADAMEFFPQFLGLQGRPLTPAVQVSTQGEDGAIPTDDEHHAAVKRNQAGASLPPRPNATIPLPVIEDRKQSFQVVLSSSITRNNFMTRKLQELFPSLDMITRDHRNNDHQAREADITLSASTGLMLTALQKLKQKPLPGQRNFHGIREQVAVASLRYEHLIVLVSEGKQQTFGDGENTESALEISSLDERNTAVLCDFTSHCDLLNSAQVTVQYVPGGDVQLTHWLAAIISRYASTTTENFALLQDETLWERFVRKAGLNAYAAQYILSELKQHGDGLFGLSAFICMTEEERVQRFGPLMGGDGMLRRASKAIDGCWTSVASVR